MGYLVELYKRKNVLKMLIWQNLALRYRKTALGYLWSLLNPLLMMSIIAIVFSSIFKSDLKAYAVFLFAGMIPWNFFSAAATQSCGSLINNEGLIKKIYLPKMIFPLSVVLGLLIDSILSFISLFIIIFCVGSSLSISFLFLPIAYLLLFLFVFGISLLMSISTIYLRDLQHILLVVIQGLFFATPIFYDASLLAGKAGFLLKLNPFTLYIDLFRYPIYQLTFPPFVLVMKTMVISLFTLFLGYKYFLLKENQIIFRL